MKKIGKRTYGIIAFIVLSVLVVSFKNQPEETSAGAPAAPKFMGITINWGGAHSGRRCVAGDGICIVILPSIEAWNKYELKTDEGKAEASVADMGKGTQILTLHSTVNKLSKSRTDAMLKTKQLRFSADSYIPQVLIDECYKNAGIKNPPTNVKIEKGGYPIEFKKEGKLASLDASKWVITTTIEMSNTTKPYKPRMKITILRPRDL